MDCVPFETAAFEVYPSRQRWDAEAADLVATMLHRWNLSAAEPFVGGESGAVLRVMTAAGMPAVLKLGFPHVEAIFEAVALEAWAPDLAPTVLRQDAWSWALLLEEVVPGIPMSRWEGTTDDALTAGAELLANLSAAAMPSEIPSLDEAMRPFVEAARSDDDLLTAGLDEFETLSGMSSDFVHGDFNPGNILLGPQGWVTIDPKPMRGDAAFDLWPLVSQLGSGSDAAALERRLLLAASVAGIDPERAARWAFARSALNISWMRADGSEKDVQRAIRETGAWRAVSGL